MELFHDRFVNGVHAIYNGRFFVVPMTQIIKPLDSKLFLISNRNSFR